MNCTHAFRCLLAVGMLLPASAPAADFCVNTSASFLTALDTAASSPEDDEIRVVGTTLTLAEQVSRIISGALAIRGGYQPGCPDARTANSFSSIQGPGTSGISLQVSEHDLTFERLQFGNFSNMSILTTGTGASRAARVGQILILRSAWIANQSGLSVFTARHDVRVESSLFIGSQANGGNIHTGAGLSVSRTVNAAADIDITIINNTAFGNQIGFVIGHDNVAPSPPLMVNNISYNNRFRDVLVRVPVILEHSLWINGEFSLGGAVHPASSGNLNVDPQLDGNYRPIIPGSPVIDSGSDFPHGGLPLRDREGNPRRIGGRVDRGAYESTSGTVQTLTVTSAANSGAGTLRQAIADANADATEKRIVFAIAGSCPAIISLTATLPALTTAATIAGETQPGSLETVHPRLFDGSACVVINGGGNLANGLHLATTLASQRMAVSGLIFYGFNSEAIRVSGPGKGILRGNLFGTGAPLIAPGFPDAVIRVDGAPGSLIGGRSPDARNVIGRGAVSGIHLVEANARRSIVGNSIGIALSGSSALANGTGILVSGGINDLIDRNYIGFNTGRGIRIVSGSQAASNTLITHNALGIAPGRASVGSDPEDAGNASNAARVESGSGHRIIQNNVRFNGTDALVVLAAARQVEIAGNQLSRNLGQGIDLSPDGINPIDNDVGATGANDSLNFPILNIAEGESSHGTVGGVLQSRNGTFRIDVYAGSACDGNNFGEAELLVGSGPVTITNAALSNGSATFSIPIADREDTLIGRTITAIAVESNGNSSEISACRTYVLGPNISANGFE